MNPSEPGYPAGSDAAPTPGHPAAGGPAGDPTPWAAGPSPYPAPYPPRRPTNNMALAAMIVGVVSLVSCPLIGAVAIYLGKRARTEIQTTGEEGDGLALAGLIMGWIAIGLTVLMIGLFVIIIGGLVVTAP